MFILLVRARSASPSVDAPHRNDFIIVRKTQLIRCRPTGSGTGSATPSNRVLFINLTKSNRNAHDTTRCENLLKVFSFSVLVRRREQGSKASRAIASCTSNTCSHLFCYNSLLINGVWCTQCIRMNVVNSENGIESSERRRKKIVEIVKRRQKQTHFSHSQFNTILSLAHSLTYTQTFHEIDIILWCVFVIFIQQKNIRVRTHAHRTPSENSQRPTRIRRNSNRTETKRKKKKNQKIFCVIFVRMRHNERAARLGPCACAQPYFMCSKNIHF